MTPRCKINFSLFWDSDIPQKLKAELISKRLKSLIYNYEEFDNNDLYEIIDDFDSVCSGESDIFNEDLFLFAVKNLSVWAAVNGVHLSFTV